MYLVGSVIFLTSILALLDPITSQKDRGIFLEDWISPRQIEAFLPVGIAIAKG